MKRKSRSLKIRRKRRTYGKSPSACYYIKNNESCNTDIHCEWNQNKCKLKKIRSKCSKIKSFDECILPCKLTKSGCKTYRY